MLNLPFQVLVSQAIGFSLLLFFQLASRWPNRPIATALLKTIRYFYTIAIILVLSVSTASLVIFLRRRSRSIRLYANFGYNNFYVNTTLALASSLFVIPVVVLVMIPPTVRNKQGGKEANLWHNDDDKNFRVLRLNCLIVGITNLFCIAVTWVIWSVGIRNQHYPTRIVFGGKLNLQVSGFLYEHANSYIMSVCVFMTALPIVGFISFATLWAFHRFHTNKGWLQRYLEVLRDTYRDLYFLFGLVQFAMFIYIRGQAIFQAKGPTSETDWGFGQILVIFTWLPLILKIGSEIVAVCLPQSFHVSFFPSV